MYCKFAIVNFNKPTVTLWELRTNLTKEMYRNMCYLVVLVQLLMRRAVKDPVDKYYIVLDVKLEDAIMNDCKQLSRQLICDIQGVTGGTDQTSGGCSLC
jgi:hypothetical protein